MSRKWKNVLGTKVVALWIEITFSKLQGYLILNN